MVDPQLLALAKSIPGAIEEGMLTGASIAWNSFLAVLCAYWPWFMGAMFIWFFIVTIKAMLGRWGALGSFLYNFFYFGALFILGLIFGPGIFVNDWFNAACTIILYPACYWLVGRILVKTGMVAYA